MQFIAERNEWEQHLGKGRKGRRGRAVFLSKTGSHRGNISYVFKGCTEETFWREIQHLHEGLWEFSTCVSLFLHGKIPGSSCVVWKTVGIHSQCGYFFYRYRTKLRTWLFKLCKKRIYAISDAMAFQILTLVRRWWGVNKKFHQEHQHYFCN